MFLQHLIHTRDGCQMDKPGARLRLGRSHPAEEIHLQTMTGVLIKDGNILWEQK